MKNGRVGMWKCGWGMRMENGCKMEISNVNVGIGMWHRNEYDDEDGKIGIGKWRWGNGNER